MERTHKLLTVIGILIVLASGTHAQKLKPDEIITKHLDSIGAADVRANLKTLVVGGTGSTSFTIGKDITLTGTMFAASDETKNAIGIKINSNEYRGETFAFTGSEVLVGYAYLGSRSVLGTFVQGNRFLVSEGLLGGVLSTRWALANLVGNKAKLSGGGMKKVGGKECYVVEYLKKGGGDLSVVMYFEKDTFRHIRTEYKRVASAGIGFTPEASSRISEVRYLLTEEFDDFRAESGLNLPHSYRLLYSVTGGQSTTGIAWKFALGDFVINEKLDPNGFAIPKE